MRATLLLLKRDPEGINWTREGDPLTFEDGPDQSGEDKARAYGEEWVGEDPEDRQYSIIPERFERVRSSGEKR